MAMFPDRFRDTVLAELMPPLAQGRQERSSGRASDGASPGSTTRTPTSSPARGKEFIQQLFPAGEFYATLLPPRVQQALGKVGRSTEPARRMLARIGFRYVDRIDPFDGGPHYEAKLAEISLVRAHRRLEVAEEPLEASRARSGGAGRGGARRPGRTASGPCGRGRGWRAAGAAPGGGRAAPGRLGRGRARRRAVRVSQPLRSCRLPRRFPFPLRGLDVLAFAARRAASSASRPQGSMSSGLSWASSGGRK